MHLLVTGGAGFIGSNLCERLVGAGHRVVAVDNFDLFYPAATKRRNLERLSGDPRFTLIEADIRAPDEVEAGLAAAGIDSIEVIVHLAARAGVRPSIEAPLVYSTVNLDGTVAMLELARKMGVKRFVFGSSSSVYGNNEKVPFSEDDPVDRPISPYAATKRAGELLCHTYHHLHDLTVLALRFFTVYGPRQRPDLAIRKFSTLMLAGEEIPMFGDGTTERDYTWIEDILDGVVAAEALTAEHPGEFEIINLGESRTTELRRLIELLAESLEVEPRIRRLPMQPGDVVRTYADVSKARKLLGYRPSIPVEAGIPRFAEWIRQYHGSGAASPAHIPEG